MFVCLVLWLCVCFWCLFGWLFFLCVVVCLCGHLFVCSFVCASLLVCLSAGSLFVRSFGCAFVWLRVRL